MGQDLSRHMLAGTARLLRPLDGHTWTGEGDLMGFVYQMEAHVEVGRTNVALVLKFFFLPPERPAYVEPVG